MFYQETCERCCEDKVESWYSGGKIDEGALAGGYINQIKTVALCSIEPCQIWPVNAIYTVLREFPLMWQSCFCIALMKYETTLSSPRTITANCPADDNPVVSNHKTESTSCFLASRSTSLKMKICFSFLRGLPSSWRQGSKENRNDICSWVKDDPKLEIFKSQKYFHKNLHKIRSSIWIFMDGWFWHWST